VTREKESQQSIVDSYSDKIGSRAAGTFPVLPLEMAQKWRTSSFDPQPRGGTLMDCRPLLPNPVTSGLPVIRA